MRRSVLAAACLAASPALSEEIHPDRAFVLNCDFGRSCISDGCGEEDYKVTLEVEGAQARFRDHQVTLNMTGGYDPASGQMSFTSEPSDGSSYFVTDFGNAGAVLSIHTQSEGRPIVIAFDGRCEEVQ
ncbi:hypothetical protein C8J30_101421 [Rhodobacter viridis]|uniref:Uncharacterized protein n=1 Tax=Rhodobacter viridis TaxID=1054202 RepID=A0A318U637_9RHOB|nr:hypothetical protein [Rhodobacter viridis]PYF13036.1 hypothetical protein C8J30_101421 [Rhodobacter viridis]